jgi:membrane-bound lytic murein transglycosylase A
MTAGPKTPTGPLLRRGALTKPLPIRSHACRLALLAGVMALSACADLGIYSTHIPIPPPVSEKDQPKTGFGLVPISFEDLPGWKTDRHSEILPAFLKSCDLLQKQPKSNAMGVLEEMGHIEDWLPICQSARIIRPGNAVETQYFFESQFQAYSVGSRWTASGLFTGYYEASLNGAFGPDARYRYPILSRPKDLISADLGQFDHKWTNERLAGRLHKNKYIPYYTRTEIEAGVLNGRQLEILWVDSPIDAFFLHIQGSGRVNLADGTYIRLAYAARNGHRYTAIGRELVAAGLMRLDDVTMPALRDWMKLNPIAGDALRKKNKSYIFFRISNTSGPVGAQGALLTPGRSLAVDAKYIPYGVPLWLATTDPGTGHGIDPKKPLRRLVVAQDTGSAIKGAIRGDLFWGHGEFAATKAGLMKEKGTYFLLLPKSAKIKPQDGPGS